MILAEMGPPRLADQFEIGQGLLDLLGGERPSSVFPASLALARTWRSVGALKGSVARSKASRTVAPPGKRESTCTDARPVSTCSAHPETPRRYWTTFWTQRPSAVATRSSSATMRPAPMASRTASHSPRFSADGGTDLNVRRSESAIFATTRIPFTLNEPTPRRNRPCSSPTVYEIDEAGQEPGAVWTEMFFAPAGSSIAAVRATSVRTSRRTVGSSWAVIVARYPSAWNVGPRAAAPRAGAKPAIWIDPT